jgi:hypothetical protein
VVILHSDSPSQEKDAAWQLRFAPEGNHAAEGGVGRLWDIWERFLDRSPVVVRLEAR